MYTLAMDYTRTNFHSFCEFSNFIADDFFTNLDQ